MPPALQGDTGDVFVADAADMVAGSTVYPDELHPFDRYLEIFGMCPI